MNAKSLVAIVAILATVMPLRSDTPAPLPPAGAPPIEQMIAELKQIDELVKQLDDKNFDKRQEATKKLIGMGRPVVEPLERILESKPSLEKARRIREILQAQIKHQRRTLRAKLAQPINLENGIQGNTPLKDALEFLSNRYELTTIIDSNAFTAIGVQKVEEQPVQLPKMRNVPLREALHLLLGQIRGDVHGGTFLVRGNRIEVTTTYRATPAFWMDREHQIRDIGPRKIDAEFDDQELGEALRELSELSGINVTIDRRVEEKLREKVTTRLDNVPIDTAVRMLANMAGLKMVVMFNVLYVTSKENAKEVKAEEQGDQDDTSKEIPAKKEP